MTSKDNSEDQELLDRYRRASGTDTAAPSDAVRSAILAESRRVAGQLAAKGSPPPFDVSRPAANDSRWKLTAFGTAGAALLAALLIAPRYWENLPREQQSSVPAAAPAAAPTAAPAVPAAAESKSSNADAASQPSAPKLEEVKPYATPAPKLESAAPARRAESSQEMAASQEAAAPQSPAPQESSAPRDSAALLDKKRTVTLAQNYAPAPAPFALKPAPAAPPAAVAESDLAPAKNLVPAPILSADRAGAAQGALSLGAARAVRERNALEPISLQSASAAGDVAQTTLLLDQGAQVDARDTLGRTPLLLAVAQNRLEVVRLLLARGADPNAADNAGVTPLQAARDKDLREVAALLERAGAR
jgi:ankyrin repeat protein